MSILIFDLTSSSDSGSELILNVDRCKKNTSENRQQRNQSDDSDSSNEDSSDEPKGIFMIAV